MANKRVLSRVQVTQRIGLSSSEIYRRMAEGLFPPQVHVGCSRVVWIEDEIDGWFALRIANASDDEIKVAISQMIEARKLNYRFAV